MATTVNMQQLKSVADEFEKIGSTMFANEKKLSELMSSLNNLWQGEAATHYLRAFEQGYPELQQMSKLMTTTSQTLSTIATNYSKSENQVSDMIKSTLAKG